MLSMNMDISTDTFTAYQREAVEYKARFETAKAELQRRFVDNIEGAVKWNLDYASRELTVTVNA